MKSSIFLIFLVLVKGLCFAQAADIPSRQGQSFEEILRFSLSQSEDIQSKESELRSAETLRTKAEFHFAPDLNFTGTYGEAGENLGNRGVSRSYGLQSSLNLFRFGGDYFGYKSADFFYESARWDLQSTRLALEETVAVKILDLIARHQETDIRSKLLESQSNYSDVAQRRYEKGILPQQELNKLLIDKSIAEARLKDAELAEHQAQQNLKVYSKSLQIETDWPWLTLLKKILRQDFKFDVQNHPQWKFLKNKADADASFLQAKKADLWPSLDMTLGYQKQTGLVTTGLPEGQWFSQWSGLITLTIPLFSRYEGMATSKLALETQARSEMALRKTSRELESQWAIAEKDFRVQLTSAVAREKTLQISRGLYQDNLHRFQTGRSSANDLFNDQDRLYQTELLAIQGWYSVHVSYIKLCHSLGLMTDQCLEHR